ncbi:hypothetical protein ACFPMF_01635 [Larkinella bovis]|uniref:ABC transporter permease n=1 Tax=Larkinella bovis TaxID=683041 RepID=A0ABW0I9L5_9BACT
MNQTFSFHRFGLVLKLHLSEHLKSYLLGMGVLLGIWMVLLLPSVENINAFGESVYRSHSFMFGFLFCGTGAWFASEAFKVVSTPLRGIPHLMLPASRLEKFLVALLLLLVFIPVFLGIFYAVEGLCFSLINAKLPASSPKYELLNPLGRYMDSFMRNLMFITPSFFLLGSIYFPKLPFVKTGVIAFTLLLFTTIYLNSFIIRQLFPARDRYGSTLFQEVSFTEDGRTYFVELQGTPQLIINGILLLMIPSLWFISYVRFKEKQL